MKKRLKALILTAFALILLGVLPFFTACDDTEVRYSENLAYRLNAEQTGYILTGRGECVDSWISIPKEYNGKPVYEIGYKAFYNDTLLTGITIPNSINYVSSYVFYGCSSLTSIVIPDSVRSIREDVFYGCSSLQSITLPFVGYSVNETSYSTNFGYIFGGNNYVPASLKTVKITGGKSIGSSAFKDCTSLKSVTIGNSVESIGSYAFENCTSLKSVTIGNSVESIGSYAFKNCTSLRSATLKNTKGWRLFVGTSTSGLAIASTSLSNPSTVAEYLKSAYYNCNWKRT